MTTQTELLREALELADAYANAFNNFGSSLYNPTTAATRKALADKIAALAQPEQPGLIVSVCHLGDGDDPFVFQCHGRVTTSALASIDKALLENRDTHFPDGPGDYEFSLTWDEGQYGFEGRCELAPGWEFEQTGFKPLASPPIGELPHTDVEVRGHKFMVMDLPANFFDAASPTPPQAEQAEASKPLFADLIAATPGLAEELKAVDVQADEVIRQYEKGQAEAAKPETERVELPPLPKAVREMIKTHQPAEHNEWTVTSAHYTADQMRDYARAALLSADSKDAGEPLTKSYVQVVPDKCDRIVWRNNYYHLPIKQQRPQAADAQPLTVPFDVEFAADYLDGVMEDEHPEIQGKWAKVRGFITGITGKGNAS